MLNCAIKNIRCIFNKKIKLHILMITASNNHYSALSSYFTSLNGIAKLSSNNSFELHISKVAPFSHNQDPPKIKSDSGQSGSTTMNSLDVLLCFSLSLKPICRLTFPIVE